MDPVRSAENIDGMKKTITVIIQELIKKQL